MHDFASKMGVLGGPQKRPKNGFGEENRWAWGNFGCWTRSKGQIGNPRLFLKTPHFHVFWPPPAQEAKSRKPRKIGFRTGSCAATEIRKQKQAACPGRKRGEISVFCTRFLFWAKFGAEFGGPKSRFSGFKVQAHKFFPKGLACKNVKQHLFGRSLGFPIWRAKRVQHPKLPRESLFSARKTILLAPGSDPFFGKIVKILLMFMHDFA